MKCAPRTISALAPAKINLSFDILEKRQDGYHEIITLFQALDLQDKLTFKISPSQNGGKYQISQCKGNYTDTTLFPLNEENLILKAVRAFFAQLPHLQSVDIEVEIEKNIPIGAGLAGGSANAAATFVSLNEYFDNPLDESKLIELAAKIGSDIPFCLKGGTAIGKGRGEKLQRLGMPLNYHFVLFKPRNINISTPWAYNTFDQIVNYSFKEKEIAEAELNELLLQLNKGEPFFWNCFETVICKEYPVLSEIKKQLLELGCLQAHLTGSGPTMFGLVKNVEHGQEVLKKMLEKAKLERELILEGWLAKTIDHGISLI